MTSNGDHQADSTPDTVTPPPDSTPDSWLTVSQAAAAAGVHRNTVRKRVRAGQVPGAYLHPGTNGDEWRIPLASVEALRTAQRPVVSTLTTPPDTELVARVRQLEQELEQARSDAERSKADAALERAVAQERAMTIQALTAAIARLPMIEATTSEPTRRRWWRRSQ